MNHYEILGLKKNATQNEIRDAYKKLIKKYHPDLYQGDKTFAEKKTQSINAAYDVLSDTEKRKKYDEEITPPVSNYEYAYKNPYNSTNYNYNKNYYNSRNTSNNSNYSYDNYKKNNASQYSTYDDFYQRRYSNYHRSKTPTSNYTDYSSKKTIFESVLKTSKQRIIAIIIIFLIYFGTLFSNVSQYTINYKNKNNNNTDYQYTESPKDKYSDYENFDINDYYTDDELYEAYEEQYSEMFDTFENFKDAFSKYVYVYLYND